MAASWVSNSGRRDLAGEVPEDLDVLACGVKDLEHPGIGEEPEQRCQIDARGERIDRGMALVTRQLDQAELRIVGPIAHELGVERHERLVRERATELLQLIGGREQRHPIISHT